MYQSTRFFGGDGDTFEKFKIEDNYFTIYYYDSGYDLYDCSTFSVPIDNIINGTWKEYIDLQNDKKQQERYEYELKYEKQRTEERRKLYEDLRAEF